MIVDIVVAKRPFIDHFTLMNTQKRSENGMSFNNIHKVYLSSTIKTNKHTQIKL